MSMRHRPLVWPLALLLPVALAPLSPPRPAGRAPTPPVRRMPSDERQTTIVRLAAGEALHAAIEWQGAEATISLIDPVGRKVLSLDSPDWIDGREDLYAIAGAAGEYRLIVERSGAGSVRLEVDPPRRATPGDRLRAAAERQQALGDRLRRGKKRAEAAISYRAAAASWKLAAEPEAAAVARYRLAGALEESVQTAQQALRLDRALVATWGRSLAGDAALNAAGRCYATLHLVASASYAYGRAESQAQGLGDRAGHAAALVNLAQLDEEQDFQAALDRLDEAREDLRGLGFREREARILLLTGQIRYMLGAWDEAIDVASQGLDVGRGGEDEVGFLQLLAASYTNQRRWPEAVAESEQLLDVAKKRGAGEYELAAVAGLGYISLQRGQLDQALHILAREPRLAHCHAVTPAEANVLGNLGAVYSRLDRSAQAFRCFNRAVAIFHREGKPMAAAAVLLGKAEALERIGRLDEALKIANGAISKIERLRTQVAGSDLRASFFAGRQEVYELAVRILMELDAERPGHGFDHRAFEVSERMRARAFLDELAAARLDVRARAPEELLAKERGIQDRIETLEGSWFRAAAVSRSSGRLKRIEAEMRSANLELQSVRGKIRLSDDRYRSIAHPRPLGLRAIQGQVLDDDTLLLAYSLGGEESFLWVVGRSSFHVHRLESREAVERFAGDALRCFTARDGCSQRDLDQFSAKLSAAILDPAAAELAGHRLLVVADGALQHIPFAALPDPAARAGATQPLVRAHEIVHLTSASLLPMLRRASLRPQAPNLVAALGDAVFERDDPRLRGVLTGTARGTPDDAEKAAKGLGLSYLPRLEHTHDEVEQIIALAPPGLSLRKTGFAANLALVRSPEIGSYKYLHLATHAFFDAPNPELNGIVLSRYDERGRPIDGFLHAYEVYGLKLSADLVVLSACRTGQGPEVRGEGLIGLTRGFMYAGAPRVMVSLWDVDDRSTAELMKDLYHGMIREGLSPAAALRAAQIATAKKYPSPYDWAAFELQGDWR